MSKITRQVAIARIQSNDALATRVGEAIAQYEAMDGGNFLDCAEDVLSVAKKCGEGWEDFQRQAAEEEANRQAAEQEANNAK